MKRIANSRGQTLLELLIVFPVIVGFVLATVLAAERMRLRLALHWAAQHAARAAAVHGEGEACAAARAAAEQSLAPWGVRGVAVECGLGTRRYERKRADYKSADHTRRSVVVMKTAVLLNDGADDTSAVPKKMAEGAFQVMYDAQ